jgi:uncharacterized caspase-like protein
MSRKLALIIGNSEYEDAALAKLKAPEADVRALAELLRDPAIGGFDEVETLVNRPFSEAHPAVAAFFADKRPDDLLLLYFSGHGVLDAQGRLYLGLKNTRRTLLSGSALASGFIKEQMDDSRSRRQVLMLDCCHSGAFARGAKGALGAQAVTDATFEGHGRVVLTATDITQYAWEGDQVIGETANSLFTHFVIEGIRGGAADMDGDGRVTPDELYEYVFAQVVELGAAQKPRKIIYDQQGELVIARNPNPPAARPTELPPELRQLIESPFASARESAVRELERVVNGSVPGLALAAHEALKKLAADDSRRVSVVAEAVLKAYAEAQQPALPPVQSKLEPARLPEKKNEPAPIAAEPVRRATPPAEVSPVASPPSASATLPRPINRKWLIAGAFGAIVVVGVAAALVWDALTPDQPATTDSAPTAGETRATVVSGIPATTAFETIAPTSESVATPAPTAPPLPTRTLALTAVPMPAIQINGDLASEYLEMQRAASQREIVYVGSATGLFDTEGEVISLGQGFAPDQHPYQEYRRLTVVQGGNSDPAFSPAGLVAYFHFESDLRTGAIQLVTRDGQDAGRLSGNFVPARLNGLTWSPDGRYIAFTDFDRAAVYVIDVETQALFSVAGKAGESLAWSPDGRQIAFMARDNPADANDADAWVIYTVNIDGTGLTTQTSPYDGRGDFGPIMWTQDGANVVYTSFKIVDDVTRGAYERWILGSGGPEYLAGPIEVMDQRLYPWFRVVDGICGETCN